MKTQKLRLYRYHDLDLYLLYFTHNFLFYDAVKQALRLYATKAPGYIIAPGVIDELPDMTGKGIINLNIKIDEKKDPEICELLNSIKPGCRNMFIKMILRRYIRNLDDKVYSKENGAWGYSDNFNANLTGNEDVPEIILKGERRKSRAKTNVADNLMPDNPVTKIETISALSKKTDEDIHNKTIKPEEPEPVKQISEATVSFESNDNQTTNTEDVSTANITDDSFDLFDMIQNVTY